MHIPSLHWTPLPSSKSEHFNNFFLHHTHQHFKILYRNHLLFSKLFTSISISIIHKFITDSICSARNDIFLLFLVKFNMAFPQIIPIIPFFYLFKIHPIFFTEYLYLIFCKTYKGASLPASSIVNSAKLFNADWVWIFLIGRIAVKYARWMYFVGSDSLNIPLKKLI